MQKPEITITGGLAERVLGPPASGIPLVADTYVAGAMVSGVGTEAFDIGAVLDEAGPNDDKPDTPVRTDEERLRDMARIMFSVPEELSTTEMDLRLIGDAQLKANKPYILGVPKDTVHEMQDQNRGDAE